MSDNSKYSMMKTAVIVLSVALAMLVGLLFVQYDLLVNSNPWSLTGTSGTYEPLAEIDFAQELREKYPEIKVEAVIGRADKQAVLEIHTSLDGRNISLEQGIEIFTALRSKFLEPQTIAAAEKGAWNYGDRLFIYVDSEKNTLPQYVFSSGNTTFREDQTAIQCFTYNGWTASRRLHLDAGNPYTDRNTVFYSDFLLEFNDSLKMPAYYEYLSAKYYNLPQFEERFNREPYVFDYYF